jgi:hypothetical protein
MKNKITSYTPQNNSLGSYRKEKAGLYRQYTVLNFNNKSFCEENGARYQMPIIIRVYWPAQVAYACVWISARDVYSIGKGKAGGYGYCKESAAIQEALEDAGIKLETRIDGVGESAIRGAIHAIAHHIGLINWSLTIAHA